MNLSRHPGIEVLYDETARCIVVRFEASDGVPSCTLDVVTSMHSAYDDVVAAKKEGADISYLLVSSNMEGIFNMGGDLAMMSSMARSRNRSGLVHYGRMTAGLVQRTWDGLGHDIPTISAVDGDALGGGCEAALSCNYTIASRASRFAFPETRFGLWPGMGATSLVGRRISPAFATNMILDGTTLNADDAFKKGLIDRVVTRNTEKTVRSTLTRIGRNGEARLIGLARMRRQHARYTYEEAMAVVAIWVDAVMSASERTLNHIDRIVKAQVSRLNRISK